MQAAQSDPQEAHDRLWEGVSGQSAWDVGANVGQSVGQMLALGFTKVVAFEPAWESYLHLAAAYGQDTRVALRQVAVSDHEGTLAMAIRSAPIEGGQLVAAGMPYHGEHSGEPGVADWGADCGERELECITLDSLVGQLGAPDLVKVDTEGHEGQVLRGATELIRSRAATWLVEFHDQPLYHECVELLLAGGYDVETIRHPHYPPESFMWYRHGWLKARGI